MSMFTRRPMEDPAPMWHNGPVPAAFFNFPGPSAQSRDAPITRSRAPVTTGATCMAFEYKDGIMVAADILGSYGSLARFKNIERIMKVNDNILMAGGGDYADFQYIKSAIEQKVLTEACLDDGFMMKPKSLHCWLTHVMYNRRSKFDPLWNELVIAGYEKDEPFLGCVDKLGTAYTNHVVATGFGSYLVRPLLETSIENNPEMSEEDALKLIQKAMELLFYRDTRSLPKYYVGILRKGKAIEIRGPLEVSGYWEPAKIV